MNSHKITIPSLSPQFRVEMLRHVNEAQDTGNDALVTFLSTVYAQSVGNMNALAKMIEYAHLTDLALRESITVNQHLLNDWSMLATDANAPATSVKDSEFSPEVVEGMEAVSFYIEQRHQMDQSAPNKYRGLK